MAGKRGALAGLDLSLELTPKAAVEDMLDRTDHEAAPWVLIEAEDKRWARVKVVESVVAAIEAGMAARNIPIPPPPPP